MFIITTGKIPGYDFMVAVGVRDEGTGLVPAIKKICGLPYVLTKCSDIVG
jgi:hypothetical protein